MSEITAKHLQFLMSIIIMDRFKVKDNNFTPFETQLAKDLVSNDLMEESVQSGRFGETTEYTITQAGLEIVVSMGQNIIDNIMEEVRKKLGN